MGIQDIKVVISGELCGGIILQCTASVYLLLHSIMFIGEYEHNIDPKKRLAMPSKFRTKLGKTVVVTRGLDKCLFVYPMSAWKELAQKLGTMPIGEASTRSFVRLMLAGATDITMDKQGRIVLPEYLREYAGIGKSVTVAGLYNRLEVWDQKKWSSYKKKAESNTDKVAQQLGELGIY